MEVCEGTIAVGHRKTCYLAFHNHKDNRFYVYCILCFNLYLGVTCNAAFSLIPSQISLLKNFVVFYKNEPSRLYTLLFIFNKMF